jgi:cytochrome c-type biogenesis protein CcmH/NrfG
VNKDNLLFATLGILFGFIAGFLLQEVMAARQPPRRVAGETAAADASAAPQGSADASGAGGSGAMPGVGADAAAAPGGGAPGQPPMAAVLELRTYVEQHPNDADAVLKLANLNFDIQNWPRARDLYTHYLELRPAEPNTLTDLGITYRQLKQYDQALDLFGKAQKIAPDHWQSRFNAVIVLAFDLKKYAAAEGVLAELRRLQPTNPDVEKLAAEVDRQKRAAA